MSNRTFDEFDEFAENYRDLHNSTLKISGAESDYFSLHKIEIVYKDNKTNPLKFLDFGCGDGNSAKHFNKLMPKSSYYGIDVSAKSIEVAKSKEYKNSCFESFNGHQIPFEDNTFDVIFAANVFHHIDFELHNILFKEIRRVLKKGGSFYLFEHNPWNPITRRIVNTCPFDIDAVLLSPKYAKQTLSNVNFQAVHINFILFFPRIKLFNPLIKLENKFKKIPFGGQYYVVSTK